MFTGYAALNGVEFANSSRVAAHLGSEVPDSDAGMFGDAGTNPYEMVEDPPGSGLYVPVTDESGDDLLYDVESMTPDSDGLYPLILGPCALTESADYLRLYNIPASSTEVRPGLYTPPEGARRFGPGLMLVDGSCWGPVDLCEDCSTLVTYDDSWPGLKAFLGHTVYRPELAPWYTSELPESGEFGGVWIMGIEGDGPVPVERPVTQLVGDGAVAGPHRDPARVLQFDVLLIACTHAGAMFGLNWLACNLRATTDATDSVLRYLQASPEGSKVDPASLLREAHGAVLTSGPRVTQQMVTAAGPNLQANVLRATFELTLLSPYEWLPAVTVPVDWDDVSRQPVNWVHAADCSKPDTCLDMPVLFSTECVPEEITVVNTPPPVCGGCLPVGEIDKYSFRVPTMDYAFRCRGTAVTLRIRNTGESPLTMQGFWRVCGTDVRCEDDQFPIQVSGLPPNTELVLDGISGEYWAVYDGRVHRPVGIVGTPNGAPWLPPIIDRTTCWDFIAQTAGTNSLVDAITMTLTDRDA